MTNERTRSVRLRAHAKINLALDWIGPLPAGYTEIQTVFQSIALADELEISARAGASSIRLEVIGADVGPTEDNLCVRASAAYFAARGVEADVRIRLNKRVPAGAGLGGGSSDAAATLRGVELLLGALEPSRRLELARTLGADVPYFLYGGTALGVDRGDRISPLPELRSIPLVLIANGPSLSTRQVFERARGSLTGSRRTPKIARLLEYLDQPDGAFPPLWNDLQPAAIELCPAIAQSIAWLEQAGGRAAMSGSGNVVFGLFESSRQARAAAERLREAAPQAWVVESQTLTASEFRRLSVVETAE
jgi:4-diphosphocytidyl-2-C-methyl-D-erythritol kinase